MTPSKVVMATAMQSKIEAGKLLIGGEWRDATGGKTFATVNPATAEVLTTAAEASAADVDAAVQAARKAFDDPSGPWRKMSASERGRLLWKIAELVEQHIDELAELET